jgi:hypothetical protein
MEKYNIELLFSACSQYNVTLTDDQVQKFITYYEMLIEKNKVMNLTAITEYEDVVYKHFVDSISILKYFDFKNCKDEYDGKAPYTILSILEPFMYGQKDPNHSVRYEVKNDYSRKYLKVTSVSCKDNNGKDEALTMVKNFINSLGFTEANSI